MLHQRLCTIRKSISLNDSRGQLDAFKVSEKCARPGRFTSKDHSEPDFPLVCWGDDLRWEDGWICKPVNNRRDPLIRAGFRRTERSGQDPGNFSQCDNLIVRKWDVENQPFPASHFPPPTPDRSTAARGQTSSTRVTSTRVHDICSVVCTFPGFSSCRR